MTTSLSPAELWAWREIVMHEADLPERPRTIRPAPMTVEVAWWEGKPPVRTTYTRRSLAQRIAESRALADLQRHGIAAGLFLSAATLLVGQIGGAW